MLDFDFQRPTRYIFGHGKETEVAKILNNYNVNKVLIVYGKSSAKKTGLLGRVQTSCRDFLINYETLGNVQANPRDDLVYSGIKICKEKNIDFILAVGGGSVIDTAKAIAIGAFYDGDFFDFYLKKETPKKALPIGVILTIPASGSEGSVSSVIQKEINGVIIKQGFAHDLLIPKFAILNPELTYSLPSYQTACGIVDMMAHVMERYFTNTKNVSLTDRLCEGVLQSIIENTEYLIRDPYDYDARANIMFAGTLAHNNILGLGREQDWATHHLEHQLSALYDIAHGAGLAIMFPAWMEYTLDHNVMRFCQFAHRVFGIDVDFENPSITATEGIKVLRAFFYKIGMPLSFSDIGAKKEDIPKLLDMLDIDNHTEGKFVVLKRQDCENIYRIAAKYEHNKHRMI